MDTNQIIDTMNRIGLIPGAQIDRGFLQGHDAVHNQLKLRFGEDVSLLYVDGAIKDDEEGILEIQAWVEPYSLPDDYLFWLKFYGGLLIETIDYNLTVDGIGPMAEEWYGFLMGDSAYVEPHRDGLLKISELSFNKQLLGGFPRVIFFMDIAGIVEPYSIIGVGPWSEGDPELFEIIKDFDAYPTMWRKVAASFSQWLELIAQTQGNISHL